MVNTDHTKAIYLIVHGQKQLEEKIREKLVSNGFKSERMQFASLDKVGETGEYVAMVWPPMSPREIIVSEIMGKHDRKDQSGMGAWTSAERNEIERISL
jgi:hypothetical protein